MVVRTAGRLQGKIAVITGGNSGIGLATAALFAQGGAKVAIFGRDRKTLDAAASQIGQGTLAIQGDVRVLSDLERLFDTVASKLGLIDIVVANAGIAKFHPLENYPEALFDEVSDINFKGVFYTVVHS